jgi:hypothetical protein
MSSALRAVADFPLSHDELKYERLNYGQTFNIAGKQILEVPREVPEMLFVQKKPRQNYVAGHTALELSLG